MAQAFWTAKEDKILRAEYKAGTRIKIIAEKLSKTRNSVIGRANRLGLVFPLSPSERSFSFWQDPAVVEKYRAAMAKYWYRPGGCRGFKALKRGAVS